MTDPNTNDELELILIRLIDQVTEGDGEPLTDVEVAYKAMAKAKIEAYVTAKQTEARNNCNVELDQPNDVHIKFFNEGYKKGYIDGGVDEILRHEKAKTEVEAELKGKEKNG